MMEKPIDLARRHGIQPTGKGVAAADRGGAEASNRMALFQTEAAWYRAKADKARERAQIALNRNARKVLLNDARLWDRMAEYEEQNPASFHPAA
jgi:hypothetical protein